MSYGEVGEIVQLKSSAGTTYTPFSLQHLALSASVKNALKTSTPNGGFRMTDVPLFDDLKTIHRRGFRVLDYSFFVNVYNTFCMRIPLPMLISNWSRRNLGNLEEMQATCMYCSDIAYNLDSLAPFCDCRLNLFYTKVKSTDNLIDGHTHQCTRERYPFCECQADVLIRLSSSRNTSVGGHRSNCPHL